MKYYKYILLLFSIFLSISVYSEVVENYESCIYQKQLKPSANYLKIGEQCVDYGLKLSKKRIKIVLSELKQEKEPKLYQKIIRTQAKWLRLTHQKCMNEKSEKNCLLKAYDQRLLEFVKALDNPKQTYLEWVM